MPRMQEHPEGQVCGPIVATKGWLVPSATAIATNREWQLLRKQK
jgi:hypothetical protein